MKAVVISENITIRVGLLSPNQEVAVARKLFQGSINALNLLVKSTRRFVVSAAKQYYSQGLRGVDFFNEGNIGLITPAKRYDEIRGLKFISYAVWWHADQLQRERYADKPPE